MCIDMILALRTVKKNITRLFQGAFHYFKERKSGHYMYLITLFLTFCKENFQINYIVNLYQTIFFLLLNGLHIKSLLNAFLTSTRNRIGCFTKFILLLPLNVQGQQCVGLFHQFQTTTHASQLSKTNAINQRIGFALLACMSCCLNFFRPVAKATGKNIVFASKSVNKNKIDSHDPF